MLVQNLIIFNIISIVLLVLLNNNNNGILNKKSLLTIKNELKLKQIGLIISIINILIIIENWIGFNSNYYGFQNIERFLNIYWGIDGISLLLVLLTLILGPIAILSNWKNLKGYYTYYVISINMLVILMALNFICLDLVSFYILFESTLAPLFLLIGIYGANNKNKAAYYVLIYTLASSLFMLLSIVIYYIIINSTDYIYINNIILSINLQSLLFIGIIIGIAVKTPLMPVHTWLPTVHSESPLGGSILLAGVILKLAIYGVIRLLLPNLSEISMMFTPIIYIISILTLIYSSLITLKQTDLKVIIAYSSISHLAVCMIGIFANNLIGINGSLILCLAHGFVSPALFILVGGILYDRYHNRLINYYQGLSTFMPIFSIYLVVFSFCNTGTPLSGNFVGEFLSITGAVIRHPIIGSLTAASVLLSACYQMKLTNRLTGSVFSQYLHITNDVTNREIFLLNWLLIPTIIIGIYPSFVTNILNLASSTLIYSVLI